MHVSAWIVCCSGLLPVWDWFLSVADLTILGLVWLLFRIDSCLDATPECARQLLGLAWLLLSPLLVPLCFAWPGCCLGLASPDCFFGLSPACDCCQRLIPACISHQPDKVWLLPSSGFNWLLYVHGPCLVWSCSCLSLAVALVRLLFGLGFG